MERANANKVARILNCAAIADELGLIAAGRLLSSSLTSMGLAGAAAAKRGSAAVSGAAGGALAGGGTGGGVLGIGTATVDDSTTAGWAEDAATADDPAEDADN